MTIRLFATRTGSGAAGLFVAYIAALLAVTNLIFSANVVATTRVPSGVVRTGTYGISLAAGPAPLAGEPEDAPPPMVVDIAPSGAPAAQASQAFQVRLQQVTNSLRDGDRRPEAGSLQGELRQHHASKKEGE